MKDTHTPPRSIRVPNDIWKAAQARAASEGRTVTDVLVAYLRRYGAKQPTRGDRAEA